MRQDIFPFSHHASLTSSQSGFDQDGEQHGITVLDADVDELSCCRAIDRGRQNDVRFHIACYTEIEYQNLI
jgi:hypothetical protein